MKKAKKILVMVAALALTAALAIGGTLAYLTSKTEVVTNTFTVGKVAITLDEAKVTEYGVKDGDTRVQANTYKLMPGHAYLKDPTIHVDADSEDCYLFVKVVNGISAIEAAPTIAAQMDAKGWDPVEGNYYVYNQTVAGGSNIAVFDSFTLAGNADVESYKNASITIQACAVQKDGLTAEQAWAAVPADFK